MCSCVSAVRADSSMGNSDLITIKLKKKKSLTKLKIASIKRNYRVTFLYLMEKARNFSFL